MPGNVDNLITKFGQLLIIRCFRPDRIKQCLTSFIADHLGSKFIESPSFQLNSIIEDSTKRSPIIFILSAGVDPAATLQKLAEEKQMSPNRYFTLSLGQGQAPVARRLLEAGIKKVSSRSKQNDFDFV